MAEQDLLCHLFAIYYMSIYELFLTAIQRIVKYSVESVEKHG